MRKMEKFIMFSLKYLPKIVTKCHTECWTAQVLWTHLRLKYRSLTLNTCYSDTCISKFIWVWLITIALLPRLRIPRDVKAVACSKKPAIVFTKVMYASNSSIYIYEVIWWWHDLFTTESGDDQAGSYSVEKILNKRSKGPHSCKLSPLFESHKIR